MHIDKAAYAKGRVDHEQLQAVARLGGFAYCELGETYTREVPVITPPQR